MADKPEDSEAANAGGELQRPETGAPPEVDAEIVEDGYRKPGPDSSSVKPESEEAVVAGPPPSEGVPPEPSSSARGPFALTPGIMLLIVLGLVLVMGFAIWRLAGDGAPSPSSTAVPGEPAETSSPSPLPDPIAPADTDEAAAPSASDPAQRSASDPSKIANAGVAAVKEAAADIDPAEASESLRTLPPAPAAGGNEALQNAAKNAAKTLSGSDTGDAIDLGATTPDGDELAEELPPDAGAYPSSPSSAAPVETPGTAPPDQEASSQAAGKVANDLTDLKSALAAAQALNAQQADEIAAMRDSFQQALVERDREAGSAIASLNARLDKIQSENAATPRGREAAASLALVALQRVLDSGAPYQDELDVLSRLAPGRPELDRLRAHAEPGAPTLLALKADFPAAARAARAASNRARAKGPFADFLARLETLISIRPAAPLAGDGAAAVISRAEDRLDKDMLAAAVTELEALPAPASGAFDQWLADARARLAADQAITELNAALLADFVE